MEGLGAGVPQAALMSFAESRKMTVKLSLPYTAIDTVTKEQVKYW